MRCVLSAVLGLAALGVVGCFSPQIEDDLACPTGDCPPGQSCGADQICRPDGGGDEQSFRVSWQLVSGDWDDTTCEATGLENVIIKTHEVNSDATSEDWVSCADEMGETSTLTVGDYEIWLEIRDGGDNLRVVSPIMTHDLPADETIDLGTATLPVDKGYFYATWAIVDGNGDPVDCTSIAGAGAEVWMEFDGNTEKFPCENGWGETQHYPLATYAVTLTGRNSTGGVLYTENVEATLEYGAAGVDLGYFESTW